MSTEQTEGLIVRNIKLGHGKVSHSLVGNACRLLNYYLPDIVATAKWYLCHNAFCALLDSSCHFRVVEHACKCTCSANFKIKGLIQPQTWFSNNMFITPFQMKDKFQPIKQYQLTCWPIEESLPSDKSVLLSLLDGLDKWLDQTGNGTVVIHCM